MTQGDEAQTQQQPAGSEFWRVPRGWFWACGAILLGLLLQYALFRQYALRDVVWSYPTAHDQTFFLSISYDTYEHILNQGLGEGLKYGAGLSAPAGMLLHLQASLLYLVLGPGRLSALTLHFLYFALLQVVLAWTLFWLTRRWSAVILGLGLLLTTLTPHLSPGGMIDFRIDFAAMCLFGVVMCLTIRSGLFASRGWSVAVGVAAAALILLRFITAVYLSLILSLFIGCILGRLLRLRRDGALRQLEWRRLAHIALATVIVAAATVPAMWRHRESLRKYYVVGHVTGEEKHIRVLMYGYDLLYYPRSLIRDHAGVACVSLAVMALLVTFLLARAGRTAEARREGATNEPPGDGLPPPGLIVCFLILTLLVPMSILTIDMHRSPVAGSIMLVPFLWTVLLALAALIRRSSLTGDLRLDRGLAALAGITLVTAGVCHLAHYGHRWEATRDRANLQQVVALHDFLGDAMRARGMKRVSIAATSLADYLTFEATAALVYEHQGYYCTLESHLRQLAAIPEDQALTALSKSHIVLITRPLPAQTPFDQSMIDLLPQLRRYCEKNLTYLKTFRIYGNDIAVYIREKPAGIETRKVGQAKTLPEKATAWHTP
jgi:hypothetical protein